MTMGQDGFVGSDLSNSGLVQWVCEPLTSEGGESCWIRISVFSSKKNILRHVLHHLSKCLLWLKVQLRIVIAEFSLLCLMFPAAVLYSIIRPVC